MRFTGIPAFATCQAASVPANPAPMIVIGGVWLKVSGHFDSLEPIDFLYLESFVVVSKLPSPLVSGWLLDVEGYPDNSSNDREENN